MLKVTKSAKKMSSLRSLSVRGGQGRSSSTIHPESRLPVKRKASPERTSRKKARVTERAEAHNSYEEDSRKRQVQEDGEGLPPRHVAAAEQQPPTKPKLEEIRDYYNSLVDFVRAKFEAKYVQQNEIGQGGFGQVFEGYRKADHFPVTIKYIKTEKIHFKLIDLNGDVIPNEAATMLELQPGANGSPGTSPFLSFFDWYHLGPEVVLVMERPAPCKDLKHYLCDNGGKLAEEKAKIIFNQLVCAAVELQKRCIFHRDIKLENILIEIATDVPRVRLIDFGRSTFALKYLDFHDFAGTEEYAPPEWYHHHSYTPENATVWQLGVVLFHLLHNIRNFDLTDFLNNELKISEELSNDCRRFLKVCLREVPEMRADLESLLHYPWLRELNPPTPS